MTTPRSRLEFHVQRMLAGGAEPIVEQRPEMCGAQNPRNEDTTCNQPLGHGGSHQHFTPLETGGSATRSWYNAEGHLARRQHFDAGLSADASTVSFSNMTPDQQSAIDAWDTMLKAPKTIRKINR